MAGNEALMRVLWASLWLGWWGLASAGWAQAVAPRIAVWNPEKGSVEGRVHLDLGYLERVSGWLREAGCEVSRPTAEQVADPQQFSAAACDALFLPGESYPRADIEAYRSFADAGGVLVALGAKVPFLMALARNPDGTWTMSPKTPLFAWQDPAILAHFHAKYVYDPNRHDQGIVHTPTELFKKYLPQAPNLPRQRLRGWFIPPYGEGEYYPLIRSQRFDGRDVTPQLFVVQRGQRHAIFCLNEWYTDASQPELWGLSRETVVALARLAADLRHGRVHLDPAAKIAFDEHLPPPEPLQTRLPGGSVEPDGATPVVRWGRFDGASLELGEPLAAGASANVAPGDKSPRALPPGASVALAVPAASAPQPRFLRVRGAFVKTGAGLSVAQGGRTLWSETFNYVDASGAGNWGAQDVGNSPAEFTRIVFLPPADGPLTLRNHGREPVYFDAIQVERYEKPAPEVILGLNGAYDQGWPKDQAEPPALAKTWTSLRGMNRGQWIGKPGEPDRWAKVDELIERELRVCPNLHLLLEGTPEWAAISPERYAVAKKRGRPHCTAPDPVKYEEIVRHVVERFGSRIHTYEIWNEAESNHFYYGTHAEYIAFFKHTAEYLRKLQPDAKIITSGMAGFRQDFVDAFAASGTLSLADYFGFHPYAGKSPGWDIQYGLLEGSLYAHGIGLPIYCNEVGFPWRPCEWFQPPPNYNPETQAQLLNVATARLLANGMSRLSVFHAGGNQHEFGLIDEKGIPRPGYLIWADYQRLSWDAGRRLDLAMAPAGNEPLQGVYAAAARHADGSVTVVLNPVEVARFQPVRQFANPGQEFAQAFPAGFTGYAFNGKSSLDNGQLVLTPGKDKPYVAFSMPAGIDLRRWPICEIAVSELAGTWWGASLQGEATVDFAKGQKAETCRIDLRRQVKGNRPLECQLVVRLAGGGRLDYIRFLADPQAPPPPESKPEPPAPMALVLRLPWPGQAACRATLRAGDREEALAASLLGDGGTRWAEIPVALTGRVVVTLAPGEK